MSTHADFYIVGFGEHLGNNVSDLNVPWATFKGNESSKKIFHIDGDPLEFDKYLLMQVLHVDSSSHIVKINGVDLAGIDITRSPEPNIWNVILDLIDAPLQRGENTIQIIRASGGDNFVIGNVFIHWREVRTNFFWRLLPGRLYLNWRVRRLNLRHKVSAPIRVPSRASIISDSDHAAGDAQSR